MSPLGEGPGPVQEEDRVAHPLRAWIAVASVLVVTLALIGASWWLLRAYAARHTVGAGAPAGEPPLPVDLGYGVHERTERPVPPTPPEPGYGWLDRENGVVTIPIEAAMDLVVRLHREGGGP
ncbi:MAG TPA: hypothetical protein VE173_07345 [Longimicrobiales bacterium]|nr:hypothetical protein [Longimicrobiales bacterium]